MSANSSHPSVPIVSVVGDGSNCGKTGLACGLIEHFAPRMRVGALKISTGRPDHTCARTGLACGCLRFDGDMRLLEGEVYTNRRGKDTSFMHAAGASRVLWFQTTSDRADEAALSLDLTLPDLDLLIVEGAALARVGRTDHLIAVRRSDRDPKDGFQPLWDRADLRLESASGADESQTALLRDAVCHLDARLT